MLPAFGLYTHIRANQYRSVFLIGSLFALVYLLTYAGALAAEAFLHPNWRLQSLLTKAWWDLGNSFPWVTGGTAIWVAIAWYFNQSIIGLAVSGHEITRTEFPKLYDMLENLCISRGMTMPKFEIMETEVPNAFASGVNESQYKITLTRGLIDMMDEAELEAVIAHELTHIRNGDVRLMVIAGIIAGVIAFFAELMFRWGMNYRPSRSSDNDNDGKGKGGAYAALAIAVAMIAVAWVLSLIIRLSLSRSREFLADAGAAELTKNPDAMISALRKIEGKGEIPNAPSAVMDMCLDNPRQSFADLFSTHPSVDVRVDALVRYAGGHDVEAADPIDQSENQSPAPDQIDQGSQPPMDRIDQAGSNADAPPPQPAPGRSTGFLPPRVPGRRRMPWG